MPDNDDLKDDLKDEANHDAAPLPVAIFRTESLIRSDDHQRPSVRWRDKQRRVLVPIMGVSVASTVAAALLGALRGEAAIGVAFVATMPVIVGVLAGMIDVGVDDRPPSEDDPQQRRKQVERHRLVRGRVLKGTAAGTLAAIVASAVGIQEGALCVAMMSPIYFFGAITVAHLLVKPIRSRLRGWLRSKDRKWLADHPGSKLLGLLFLVVGLPAASGPIDRWLFIDPSVRAVSTSAVTLPVPIDDAWASLQSIDIRDMDSAPLWLAPLLPRPLRLTGGASAVGDVRHVVFDNGEIEAVVTAMTAPTDYRIDLRVVWSGREFFDHWLTLEHGTFHFDAVDDHHTRLVHEVHYQPKLFPRAVFEPLERAWGEALQQHLLDSFAATITAHQPVTVAIAQ